MAGVAVRRWRRSQNEPPAETCWGPIFELLATSDLPEVRATWSARTGDPPSVPCVDADFSGLLEGKAVDCARSKRPNGCIIGCLAS
jgi:hypothetical protein